MHDSQTFTLPDGRIMGFSEYGNPDGYPLIFLHGLPCSRLEAEFIVTATSRGRDLCIICPDRPGFGLSTFQKNRKILDWPADLQALLDHLDISRCAILGGSSGGPYVLACAYMLPPEMMSAVGIVRGAPPWDAGTKNFCFISRAARLLAKYGGLTTTLDVGVALFKCFLKTPAGIKAIEKSILSNDDGEKQSYVPIKERRKEAVRKLLEAYAQGSRGIAYEARILSESWGIDFEKASYDPIRVWHSTDDMNAPISMVRYMVDRLPHVILQEFEGDHYTILKHFEEMLLQLVPPNLIHQYTFNKELEF